MKWFSRILQQKMTSAFEPAPPPGLGLALFRCWQIVGSCDTLLLLRILIFVVHHFFGHLQNFIPYSFGVTCLRIMTFNFFALFASSLLVLLIKIFVYDNLFPGRLVIFIINIYFIPIFTH